MPKKKIKTISNELEEFIPEGQRDLDVNAASMEDRPWVFVGKRANRDQHWIIQDMIELKNSDEPNKGVKGMGSAFKYMWENLISEVKNVIMPDGEKASIKGDDKNALWYSEGMEEEINEAITYFYTRSKMDEDEVKTSV